MDEGFVEGDEERGCDFAWMGDGGEVVAREKGVERREKESCSRVVQSVHVVAQNRGERRIVTVGPAIMELVSLCQMSIMISSEDTARCLRNSPDLCPNDLVPTKHVRTAQ